jgi:hypothetical protein
MGIYESPTVIGNASGSTTEVEGRLRDPRVLWTMRVLWTLIALLSVVAFAVAIPYYRERLLGDAPRFTDPLRLLGLGTEFYATVLTLREVLLVLPGVLLGAYFYWRRSDNRMVLLLSIAMVTFAVSSGEAIPSLPAAWDWLRYFINVFSLTITVVVILVLPDGQINPRLSFLLVIATMVWEMLYFYPPLGLWRDVEQWGAFRLGRLALYFIALLVQIVRYRRFYNQSERQQTKWVIFGLTVVLLGNLLVLVIRTVWPVTPAGDPNAWVWQTFVLIPLLRIVPNLITYLSLIFAISRYRLWEVDLIINRGLVVGGLAVLLAAVFFGIIATLHAILQAVTGTSQSNLAIIVSALVSGALFNPVYRRLQRFVDRRLYGIKVNFRGSRSPHDRDAATDATRQLPARTFGSYEVTGMLGRGGMGEVYRARHPEQRQDVAVKVLPASKASDEDFRARFEREATTVAALHHPNIIQVFDYGRSNGDIYMVMEYIDGQGLDAYIREHGPLPLDLIRSLLRDVCAALDYAHDHGLVHRDIKPSNIMLQQVTTQLSRQPVRPVAYRAVLMDFGVARMVTDTTGLTQSGVIVGTFDYMAPEQISGSSTVDRRADIYALGVVLYQMLTGTLPFAGDNPGVIVFAHLQRPPPDPREVVPGLSPSVAYAVKRAMAKQPDDRFQRAGELAAELDFAGTP